MFLYLDSFAKNNLNYISDPHETPLITLGPIGKVNIFIGANNSGKSRFLRALANHKTHIGYSNINSPHTLHAISAKLKELKQLLGNKTFVFKYQALHTDPDLNPDLIPEPLRARFREPSYREGYDVSFDEFTLPEIQRLIENIISGTEDLTKETPLRSADIWMSLFWLAGKNHPERLEQLSKIGIRRLTTETNPRVADLCENIWEHYIKIRGTNHSSQLQLNERIYIPTLRGAVLLSPPEADRRTPDRYAEVVRKNYSLSSEIDVFTGQKLYDTLGKDRLGTGPVRRRLEEFEQFLGDTFFDDKHIKLIALESEDPNARHIIVASKGLERELHQLGDGINALLILAYRLFTANPHSWFFIEEPEVHLHPGLQRLFLETILSHPHLSEKSLTVFLTSHSNHLLDLAIKAPDKVSIFSFQKKRTENDSEETFTIRAAHHSERRLLDNLGVNNSSVLLANCSIWVEGPTDRIYVRAYLEAYKKHLQSTHSSVIPLYEDFNFSFFEYAGSNIQHYYFAEDSTGDTEERIKAQFISNRILLIADADSDKEDKHNTLWSWQNKWFAYLVTPCSEIENLVSPSILRRVCTQLSNKIASDSAKHLSDDLDYVSTRLGDLLTQNIPGFPKAARGDGGTLSPYYKSKLAELVAQNCTWETMSSGAQQLAIVTYQFIEKHNSSFRGSFV